MKRMTVFLAIAAFALAMPNGAYGSIVAGDYTGGGTLFNFSRAGGFSFTANTSMRVTGLGIYDLGAAGFASSHDIGIFRVSDNSVVSSATIGAGLSGTFVAGTVDGTRFVNVASFGLKKGVQYYILGNNFSTDQYVFGGGGAVTFDSALTWNGFVDGESNSIFSNPIFQGGLPGNLGPNFMFSAVPEPTTLMVWGVLGLAGLGLRRRKS